MPIEDVLHFIYINYKGNTSHRRVIKPEMVFRDSAYHGENEPLWLLHAFDLDKNEYRDFAIEDVIKFL